MSKTSGGKDNKELRKLPSIEVILEAGEIQAEIDRYSRVLVAQSAQAIMALLREQILGGASCPTKNEIIQKIKQHLVQEWVGLLRPLINGTGVILHTNLGRAPLSQLALSSLLEANQNYCNLEYDLALGERGRRVEGVEKLLCVLTRAESALVVNNNAGAVLLILAALAKDKEVIVSRGELVQIGGGFRIPEIIEQSGAHLREVGTTNQTYIQDYEGAIGDKTALLLRVHQSNFKIRGFTHQVSISELKTLGRKYNLPVVDDLGSGALLDTRNFGLEPEPMVQETITQDTDIVCFSGDKLLGGPQSGIILGKKSYLDRIRRYPLLRALRIDKMSAIALQTTLLHYLKNEATEKLPVWQMVSLSLQEITSRAEAISKRLNELGIVSSIRDGFTMVGGGSLPDQTLASKLVAIEPTCAVEDFARRLRFSTPALLGRIDGKHFLIDVRTIAPSLDDTVIEVIRNA